MNEEKYISIPQLAKLLGISRIAVYQKVKSGQIKALKIGRNYAIPMKYVTQILGSELNEEGKKQIERGVKRAVKEYGETLKLLGRE